MKKPIIVLTVTVLAAVLAVFVLAAFAVTRSQSTTGIPLGPNDLPSSLYAKPYTGSKLLLTSAHAIDTLRALHTSGMRVIIRLAGRQENYQNADGSFSLEKWKAQIDRFRRVNLSKFIVDGTIVAHQIVSEAKAPAQWGGTIIPNDVLDEMARYSKSIWPGMETVVRTDPTDFEEDAAGIQQPWPGWQWKYLDAASPRYLARKDDVAAYFRAQQASADRQGLGVVVGLNVLSGGDGTSGVPSPTKDGAWTLSADEVRRYGSAMLTETRGLRRRALDVSRGRYLLHATGDRRRHEGPGCACHQPPGLLLRASEHRWSGQLPDARVADPALTRRPTSERD